MRKREKRTTGQCKRTKREKERVRQREKERKKEIETVFEYILILTTFFPYKQRQTHDYNDFILSC